MTKPIEEELQDIARTVPQVEWDRLSTNHNHYNPLPFQPDCPRCRLNRAAPKLLRVALDCRIYIERAIETGPAIANAEEMQTALLAAIALATCEKSQE